MEDDDILMHRNRVYLPNSHELVGSFPKRSSVGVVKSGEECGRNSVHRWDKCSALWGR